MMADIPYEHERRRESPADPIEYEVDAYVTLTTRVPVRFGWETYTRLPDLDDETLTAHMWFALVDELHRRYGDKQLFTGEQQIEEIAIERVAESWPYSTL